MYNLLWGGRRCGYPPHCSPRLCFAQEGIHEPRWTAERPFANLMQAILGWIIREEVHHSLSMAFWARFPGRYTRGAGRSCALLDIVRRCDDERLARHTQGLSSVLAKSNTPPHILAIALGSKALPRCIGIAHMAHRRRAARVGSFVHSLPRSTYSKACLGTGLKFPCGLPTCSSTSWGQPLVASE